MKKKIVIEILPDGEVRLETHGYQGPSCLEESKFIKDLLGRELERHLIPAYYRKGRKVIKKHLPLCG